MAEQVQPPANGTPSRIFSPDQGEAPRRVAADAAPPEHIERDPVSGRFLKPGFPGHLVAKARRLGLTDEDLADIEDPRELRDIVRERDFEVRLSQVFDPEKVAKALKTPSAIETPTARQPLDLGLNDEEDSPRLIEALNKLRDHYEGEIDGLRKKLDDVTGKQTAREQQEGQSFARRVEKSFAKHRQIFGEGTIDKLDRNSAEFHFRMAAVAAHRASGGGLENLEEDIDSFVKAKFGGARKPARARPAEYEHDDEEEVDDEEDADPAEEWERGVLARPTQAGSREAPPGVDKARQGLRRRLAAAGAARDVKSPRGIYLNHGRRAPGTEPQR